MVLGGSGDVVSRLIVGMIRLNMWAIGFINLLTSTLSPPDPPSIGLRFIGARLGSQPLGLKVFAEVPLQALNGLGFRV